MMITLWNLATN